MDIVLDSLYQKIFNSALVAIGVTDLEGRFIIVNNTWCNLMGYNESEANTLHLNEITPTEDMGLSDINYQKLISCELNCFQKIRRYKRKDGSVFWANLNVSPILNAQGKVEGVLGVFVDIDTQVRAEEEMHISREKLKKANLKITNKNHELRKAYQALEELVRTDALTGLNNRREMENLLAQEIRRSQRNKRTFTVVIGDIDDFKMVNDTYGHDVGDVVLKELATILKNNTRTTDFLGRWGGEEFLMILTDTDCEDAFIVMERIRKSIEKHKIISGKITINRTMTFGFGEFKLHSNLEQVIKQADVALYYGKNHGKNQAICYCEKMEQPD